MNKLFYLLSFLFILTVTVSAQSNESAEAKKVADKKIDFCDVPDDTSVPMVFKSDKSDKNDQLTPDEKAKKEKVKKEKQSSETRT